MLLSRIGRSAGSESSGSLVDIGIYSLNAARYLAGEEPVEVNAMLYSTPNNPRFCKVEETVNFAWRSPSGVLANCLYLSNLPFLAFSREVVFAHLNPTGGRGQSGCRRGYDVGKWF